MKLVYPVDIVDAIKKIEKSSGDKVRRRTHIIKAKKTISFTDERYPLEIREADDRELPKDVELMIVRKPKTDRVRRPRRSQK